MSYSYIGKPGYISTSAAVLIVRQQQCTRRGNSSVKSLYAVHSEPVWNHGWLAGWVHHTATYYHPIILYERVIAGNFQIFSAIPHHLQSAPEKREAGSLLGFTSYRFMVCTAAAAAAVVYFVSTSTDVNGIGLHVVYLVIPGRYMFTHLRQARPGLALETIDLKYTRYTHCLSNQHT